MRVTEQADNILAAYHDAPGWVRARGLGWYARARGDCYRASDQVSMMPDRFCSVVAVLSPGLTWDKNIPAAVSVLRGGSGLGSYGRNVAKALLIRAGEHPEAVLSGPKVTAFYRLLRDGGNERDLCVDGHAIGVAWALPPELPIRQIRYTLKDHRATVQAYREASAILAHQTILGERTGPIPRPCDLQAITWEWRRIQGKRARRHPGQREIEG